MKPVFKHPTQPQLSRAERLPTGTVKDWAEHKRQQETVANARMEHLKALRESGVRVAPRPATQTPDTFTAPPVERERTFDQFCRQENMRLTPYSWMTTSPYSNRS